MEGCVFCGQQTVCLVKILISLQSRVFDEPSNHPSGLKAALVLPLPLPLENNNS